MSATREPLSPAAAGEGCPTCSRRFLTAAAAAEILGVSSATLYRQIRAGQFPAIAIGQRLIVPMKVLDLMEADAINTGGVIDAADYVVTRRGDSRSRE